MVGKKKSQGKNGEEASVLDLINQRLSVIERDYATKVEIVNVKFELLDEIKGVRQEIGKLDNKIFNTLDKIVAELENMRVDREVGTEQMREIKVVVENHEERIATLEASN